MKVYNQFTLSCILLFLLFGNSVIAQQNKPLKAKMSLEYLKVGDEKRILTISVKCRVEKRYQPVAGLTFNLFVEEAIKSNLIGTLVSDAQGMASLLIPSKVYNSVDVFEYKFIAQLVENSDYIAKEKTLLVREVFLDVDFIVRDSIKSIKAIVREKDSLGTILPTEKIEIKFLVDRPFSRLPIGGEYNTIDKEGTATIEFPRDLPGDSAGLITVIVKIEDSDLYGNVEKINTVNWGVPTIFDDQTTARSLWSAGANAPVPLLILVNSLIASVWGIIFFILFRIYQIKKA